MDSAGDILNAANPVPHPSSLPSLTPLSKNAQKKLAKAAILTEKRKARRAYEKAKKKARRTKAVLEQSAAEGLDREDENADGSGGEDNEGEEEGEVNEGPKRKKPRLSHTNPVATSSETKRKKAGKNPFKARVVIDLGFDELMSENVRLFSR